MDHVEIVTSKILHLIVHSITTFGAEMPDVYKIITNMGGTFKEI